MRYCPYDIDGHLCGFAGTDEEVDEHRAYYHTDEPQAGSNLSHRPRG